MNYMNLWNRLCEKYDYDYFYDSVKDLLVFINNGNVWHNGKLKFIPIPKCASSGLRGQFLLRKETSIKDIEGGVFTIIREPIVRFVSAYIESMKPSTGFPRGRYFISDLDLSIVSKLDVLYKNKDEMYKFKKFINYLEEFGFFEVHTARQVDFIRDLDTKKMFKGVTVFKLEYIKHIEEFLGAKLNKSRVTSHPELKKSLLNFLYEDEEYMLKVKSIYSEDIDFYNSFSEKTIL